MKEKQFIVPRILEFNSKFPGLSKERNYNYLNGNDIELIVNLIDFFYSYDRKKIGEYLNYGFPNFKGKSDKESKEKRLNRRYVMLRNLCIKYNSAYDLLTDKKKLNEIEENLTNPIVEEYLKKYLEELRKGEYEDIAMENISKQINKDFANYENKDKIATLSLILKSLNKLNKKIKEEKILIQPKTLSNKILEIAKEQYNKTKWGE